jgi:hypothetical protein
MHSAWYGVNFGRVAENLAFKSLIDNAVVFDVVVRKPNAKRDRENEKYDESAANQRIAGEKSIGLGPSGFSFRNFKLDRQFLSEEYP